MNTLLVALALVSQTPDSEELSADQFQRIMNGLYSEIQDVTFVYEGTKRRPHANLDSYQDLSSNQMSYQGLYSFRSDGATLLDYFARPLNDDAPARRNIYVMLDETMEGVSQIPDLGFLRPQSLGKAFPGALNRPSSPERIVFLWYFHTLEDPKHYGYEFQGWEKIDGHDCANVQLFRIPKEAALKQEAPRSVRFWVDFERGGHPLKVEFYKGPNLGVRSEIELGRVPVSREKSVWFPVRGVTETFTYLGKDRKFKYSRSPVSRETYAVVDGSLRINQGLDDSDFSLSQNRRLPEIAGLRRLQERLDDVPPIRTDPEGVRERLDQQLAEAEQQAEQLEASSAARQRWGATSFTQVALVLFGAALLIGSVYWKWSVSR